MTKKVMLGIVIFIILFVVAVRFLESKSVFYPDRRLRMTPAQAGLAFEDIFFLSGKYRLNGWLIKAPQAQAAVLFLHGNAGNISDRMEKIVYFHRMNLNVFIIDYRGYGKSQGRPTEAGIYEDARAAYDYLLTRRDVDPEKMIAYGESLGGAAAVHLATERPFACLILDSTFTSARDVAKVYYPWVPAFLLQTKMDSLSKIKKIKIPKIFLHSPDDEVIPYAMGEKLYRGASFPKAFLQIRGGHNAGLPQSREIFIQGIGRFLKDLKMI